MKSNLNKTILHILVFDRKFTLPLVSHLVDQLNLQNHLFIILDYNDIFKIKNNKRIIILKKKYFLDYFINYLKLFYYSFYSDLILAHALPLPLYFLLLPWKLNSIMWIIHGGIDIPTSSKSVSYRMRLELFVKRKIKYHITHIAEDSSYINKILNINASHIYSPMYLSNVYSRLLEKNKFKYNKSIQFSNILVGNSADPSNNHEEVFKIIINNNIIPHKIFSILSYGNYELYKKSIIEKGINLFNDKFIPILNFMETDEYLKFLNRIDFALFFHERQEGMGVTIQLLSLGKPIFFNSISPAYISFKRRGYKVFDINEINKFINITTIDLSINRELLKKEYSIDTLNNFYKYL
jgi:dTDP-N-acetylfucosamine:lipid II N-acetylfucosaminyltransferase